MPSNNPPRRSCASLRYISIHFAGVPNPTIALCRIIRARFVRRKRVVHPLLLYGDLHEHLAIEWPPKKPQCKIRRAREHTVLRLSADDRKSLCGRGFGVGERLEEEPIFQSQAHAEVKQLLAAEWREDVVTKLVRPCIQERQISFGLELSSFLWFALCSAVANSAGEPNPLVSVRSCAPCRWRIWIPSRVQPTGVSGPPETPKEPRSTEYQGEW